VHSHLLCCLLGDTVPDHHNLRISLHEINHVAVPIWVLYVIMKSCVCDYDMSDTQKVDEMGLTEIYICLSWWR
jgi:hypothetical protein